MQINTYLKLKTVRLFLIESKVDLNDSFDEDCYGKRNGIIDFFIHRLA